MNEFERMEKRFKQLRNWLLELQSEDTHADRDDEHESHNLGLIDLHEIKLAFFALAQERDRLRAENDKLRVERDYARQLFCIYARCDPRGLNIVDQKGIVHLLTEISAEDAARARGWDCFKEIK